MIMMSDNAYSCGNCGTRIGEYFGLATNEPT